MEPVKLVKQMITFQKTLFENSYKTICMIQEQTEHIAIQLWNLFPWIPEEGRKLIDETLRNCKNAREEFKKIVDDGFAKIEELYTRGT